MFLNVFSVDEEGDRLGDGGGKAREGSRAIGRRPDAERGVVGRLGVEVASLSDL